MIREKTMRSLESCQKNATQINEALSTVLADIKVANMNLQVKKHNLVQVKPQKQVLHQIIKYLQSEVYEPMMKKASTVNEYAQSVNRMQCDFEANVTTVLTSYLSGINELAVEFNFTKKQLNNVTMNLKLHNTSVNGQLSECVEEFEAIMTKINGIITMLLTQIGTVEDVLNNIKAK